jgi:hypothetical protein
VAVDAVAATAETEGVSEYLVDKGDGDAAAAAAAAAAVVAAQAKLAEGQRPSRW